MIIRNLIQCDCCKNTIEVHFSATVTFPQSSNFLCPHCAQPITYGYDSNKLLSLSGARLTTNNGSFKSVMISPNKSFNINSPLPSTLQSVMKLSQLGAQQLTKFQQSDADLTKISLSWNKITHFMRIVKDKDMTTAESTTSLTKQDVLTEIASIKDNFLKNINTNKLDNFDTLYNGFLNTNQLVDLKNFIIQDRIDWLEKIYNALFAYFDNENEFRKISVLYDINENIPKEKIQCHWRKIKNTYATIYEVVCSMYIIPAAITNLKAGRHWDQFVDLPTWDSYLKLCQDSKKKPFQNDPDFAGLIDGHDNDIRNGIFHESSRFDINSSEIVLKCGKDGKREKRLHLSEYIIAIDKIFYAFLNLADKFLNVLYV